MTLTELFTEELNREAPRTRRALEAVPAGRDDWKPHAKSMPLARLAGLVASMPSWVSLIIEKDELNLTPPPGQGQFQQPSVEMLVGTHDKLVAQGLNNREIAGVMWLSDRTVERHITSLYRKIGVARRSEATAFALRHGLG